MHNLAVLYAEGIDGKPDYATAVQWFRKAAQHGIADSQYNLGVLCARGLGTEKNPAESYKWFALAAAKGDRESAKKRDEVAEPARRRRSWRRPSRRSRPSWPQPQPAAAITVPVPRGGWDSAAGAQPPRRKAPRHSRAEPQARRAARAARRSDRSPSESGEQARHFAQDVMLDVAAHSLRDRASAG